MKKTLSESIISILNETAGYVNLDTGEVSSINLNDKEYIKKDIEDLVDSKNEEELESKLYDKLNACNPEEFNKWIDTYIEMANNLSYTGLADELSKFKNKM